MCSLCASCESSVPRTQASGKGQETGYFPFGSTSGVVPRRIRAYRIVPDTMPTDPDNSTEKPSWDGTQLALATFLEKLERWLYKKNPDYRSFLEEGYIINRRDVVVPTEFHAVAFRDGRVAKGSFLEPVSEQIFVDYELLPGWVETWFHRES